MISTDIIQGLSLRFRRPVTWGVILGFGILWVPARLLAGVSFQRMGAWEFFLPALILTGHLVLSPIPWQWTGDSRPRASLLRGVLQAVPWNAAWVLLLLWGVTDFVQPAKPVPKVVGQASHQDRPAPRDQPADRRPPEERPQVDRQALEERLPQDRRPAEDRPAPPPPGPRPEWTMLFLNLPFALVLGLFLSEKERVERSERNLLDQERQARARALQSQLHPHVLFNVLGGLTELVHEDPEAAEEALLGLTELLRMLMKHGSALSLPLGEERTLLERYLDIESIRLGSRLEVEVTWQDGLDRILVPPLLLQPLVENAVKHGVAPHPKGGMIRIEAIRTDTGLLLRVANTGKPLDKNAKAGTGLGNLRERLALLPEPQPSLDLRQEGDWTVAELRLALPLGP
jgi:Histidine kinase